MTLDKSTSSTLLSAAVALLEMPLDWPKSKMSSRIEFKLWVKDVIEG